ncbi:MAG: SRPBCC domain-containing protein [Chloroflexota bacterium]
MRSRVRSPPPRPPLPLSPAGGSIVTVEQTDPRPDAGIYSEIDIAAPQRQVWTVLADIASWPTWNPAIREAHSDGRLEVGSRFRFSTELGTLKCRVTHVDAPRTLIWKGRVLALGEWQKWQIEPGPAGTRVSVQAKMTGPVSRLFQRRLDARLQRVLDAVVQLLRLEAEARATEDQEEAERAAALLAMDRSHE